MKRADTNQTHSTPDQLILLDTVLDLIDNVRKECQREIDQGLRQKNIEKSTWSLAQRDCCDRVERAIIYRLPQVEEAQAG